MRLLGLSCDAQGVAIAAGFFDAANLTNGRPRCRAFVSMRQEGASSASNLALGVVDEVLREFSSTLQLGPDDSRIGPPVDAIVFNAGPGGFTAIRSACALAQGLGLAWDKPVAAVSSLQAWAQSWCDEQAFESISQFREPNQAVLVLLDARMGELYCAPFSPGTLANPMCAMRVLGPVKVLEEFSKSDAELAGFAQRGVLVGDFAGSFPDLVSELATNGWSFQQYQRLSMKSLLQAAYLEIQRNPNVLMLPELVSPIYVRDKVALNVHEQHALREARQVSR